MTALHAATATATRQQAPQALLDIPALAELFSFDQVVVWKYVTRKGKQDKPPFNVATGLGASHSNPDDWTSYEQALDVLPAYDGLGFVFSECDPYSGVDLDGCRNPDTGEIAPWALKIIRQLDSYTEISPSLTGVKVFVRGILPESVTVKFGAHVGVEIYSKNRYFTTTGQHLEGTPNEIRDAQQALSRLGAVLTRWKRRKQRPTKAHQPTTRTAPCVSPGEAAAGRLNARDTIDRANRTNDLGSYLECFGATLQYSKGSERHYSGLGGDKHDHAVTYKVSPARDGNGHIGISYSPNGKLNKDDLPRGFRWFDAFLVLEHSGNRVAALKAITPNRLKRKLNYPPHAAEQVEYRTPQQVQDAARKRQKRLDTTKQCQEWADAQTERLAADERACDTYRAAWAIHYVFFGSVGQHSVSVARMASALCNVEIAEAVHTRKMQRANEWLVEHGYLERTERYGDGRQHTNIWQPANPDAVSTSRTFEASQGHDVLGLDHDLDLNTMHGAYEPAPGLPTSDAAPPLEYYTSDCERDYEPAYEAPAAKWAFDQLPAVVEQHSAEDAGGSQAICFGAVPAPIVAHDTPPGVLVITPEEQAEIDAYAAHAALQREPTVQAWRARSGEAWVQHEHALNTRPAAPEYETAPSAALVQLEYPCYDTWRDDYGDVWGWDGLLAPVPAAAPIVWVEEWPANVADTLGGFYLISQAGQEQEQITGPFPTLDAAWAAEALAPVFMSDWSSASTTAAVVNRAEQVPQPLEFGQLLLLADMGKAVPKASRGAMIALAR